MNYDETLAQLKAEIIEVLLNNRLKNGRDVYMSGPNIGRKIGTYRQPYNTRASDPFSRKHYELLRKLKNEGRVEHSERVGWRLTKAEYNRLTLDK
ncbi:MAG: hypothetical protein OXI24_00620 [Candidatus Poribacteria bacterium]|nr:hypothetical protein [Candidatus Poribacteria bacterium]